ncbi:hypothetical protein JCM8547_008420 [Rhodosporidiobolus lusitaniae]
MLALSMRALALVLSCSAALASFPPSSPPPQLAFTAPPLQPHSHSVRLAWHDRSHLERAVGLFKEHDLDVWSAGKRSSSWETIVRWPASDDTLSEVLQRLEEAGIPPPTASDGAQGASLDDRLSSPTFLPSFSRSLSAATLANLSRSSLPPTLDDPVHNTYHPYDGIHDLLLSFEKSYPDFVKVFSLGQSSEGRDIWAVKVTNFSSTPDEARAASSSSALGEEEEEEDLPAVVPPPLRALSKKRHKHRRTRKLNFVVAGTQHAREWIAASTSLYLIHDLLAVEPGEGQRKAEKARERLLSQVEFTFVPVVNPDGYVYSWDVDRLWRKSRQPVGKDCFGIDLNRNWGFKFEPGSRPNPCSDSFPGSSAFESVELQVLRDYLLGSKEHPIDAFLDVHSFGQMLLYPYSYSCSTRTADEENQAEAVLQTARALKSVHGRQFETGSVCEVSLTSPGESLDWTYAEARIRWSFATELRDGGVFGFLLPPSQIRPSGEEMSAALRSLTQFILDKEAGKR